MSNTFINSPKNHSLLGLPISDHRNIKYNRSHSSFDPKPIPTYFLVPPLCGHASGIAGESDTGDLSGMSFYSGCRRIKLETPERVIPVETTKIKFTGMQSSQKIPVLINLTIFQFTIKRKNSASKFCLLYNVYV